jgi:predicted O-methyltransferase YrrM
VTIPKGEPTSSAAVAAWVEDHLRDRYDHVRRESERHRERHGCTVYPTGSGPLLGVLAAATAARRVLELGTGLGYSAIWLASAGAHVDTIEQGPEHARLARGCAAREDVDVAVHVGLGRDVFPSLEPGYDLVFNDGEPVEFEDDLDEFERLLRPGGLLLSANLFLGQYSETVEGLEHAVAYRLRLLEEDRYVTTILRDGLALSVLNSPE